MKLIIIFFIVLNFTIFSAYSENKITLLSLEKQNFYVMSGKEISEILLDKTVKLKDLLSEAVYEIKINKNGLIERKIITNKNPKTLTSVEYNARASLLGDSMELSIKGNKIVTTDGVRTYMSTLYKKGDIIYGVRDIDHKTVNFQIIIKN